MAEADGLGGAACCCAATAIESTPATSNPPRMIRRLIASPPSSDGHDTSCRTFGPRDLWFARQRRGRHRWPAMMCGLLEGIAKREQPSFRKLTSEELDPHRKAVGSESGGYGEGWK